MYVESEIQRPLSHVSGILLEREDEMVRTVRGSLRRTATACDYSISLATSKCTVFVKSIRTIRFIVTYFPIQNKWIV